jgi:transposase
MHNNNETTMQQLPDEPRKRKYASHSDAVRAYVLRLRAEGQSWAVIEYRTTVPPTTAKRWVKEEKEEGRKTKKARGGNHHVTASAAVRSLLVYAQAHDAALRLSDLADAVQRDLHQSPPHISTVHRILKACDFTTKHMQPYANQRNTQTTKQKRQQWVRDVGAGLTAANAVFIDETPFSMSLMRGRGRSRKGVPALGVVPAIRGKNHSVIAALSPSAGLLYYEIKVTAPEEEFISKRKGSAKKKTGPKGVTRDVFRLFLIHLIASPAFQLLASQSGPSQSLQLVCDNARIHKGDADETVFQAGYTLQFLPPYSPELNPIELAFSKWKLAYRVHYPASEEEVDPAITAAAATITQQDCQHYFEHTQTYHAACEALDDL